jgi:hypothetical protein
MLRLRLAASAMLCVSAGAASSQPTPQLQAAVAATATTADSVPNAEAWGAMARLAGTSWLDRDNGTVWEFSWVEPGEIMTWKAHRRDGEFVYRAAVNAKALVAVEVQSQVALLAPQNRDVFVLGGPDVGWRYYMRVTGTRLTTQAELFKNGAWVPSSSGLREFRPLSAAEAAAAIGALVPKQNAFRAGAAAKEAAQRAEAAAKEAELKTPWGRVSAMAGRRFTGSNDEGQWVLTFAWQKWWKKWDAVGAFLQKYGERKGYQEYIYNDLSQGKVRFQADDSSTDKFFFQPDGSFGYFHVRYRLLPDGRLEVAHGKWNKSDNSFTLRKGPWIWRPFSDAENRQRIAQIEQSKSQSGGDSGMLGGLMAGVGAAIAGGNAEMVMGAAMKGMEMSTDNQQVRNVLAGEGDAMIASGLNTMDAGNSNAGGSGPSYAQSAAPGSSGSSTHSLTRKTLQAFLYVGTEPRIATKAGEPDDGHNTHCQSNIFNITVDWDPSLEAEGANLKYVNPVLDGMKSTFIDKCNRTDPSRPTVGIAEWWVDGFNDPQPGRQLRTGDREVTMP